MKSKPTILFILHCPPPVHGSSIVGQYIKNSTLINTTFCCRYINILASRKINETGKISFIKVFWFLGIWFRLFFEIIKKKPDICYLALTATGAAFYKDVMLVFLLRAFQIKRVYHLHNKGVSKNQSSRIKVALYKYVFKDADIILLSKYLYNDIQSFVSESHVSICPNGIDFFDSKPKLFSSHKPVKILFLSNLIETKGVFVLLEACSILQNKGFDFECDFIGSEGDLNISQFDEKVNQLHLTDHVNYLGPKYGKEKQKMLSEADIFTFPTFYSNECFPLVLLEAMSEGLPVVSTYEGGIPDIVEENVTGYLVPQRNIGDLALKLEALITNKDLRIKMGNAGRLKFEAEFKLSIFEHKIVEILSKII